MFLLLARTSAFLVLLAAAAIAALLLSDDTGAIRIAWGDWIVETRLWVAVVGILSVLGASWLIGRVLRALLGLPGSVRHQAREKQHRRGLQALSRAMIGQMAGDGPKALIEARRAQRLLSDHRLTDPVMATALERAGEQDQATACFRRMTEDPATAAAGLKGLLRDATQEEAPEILEIARRVVADAPKDRAALEALFSLQVRTAHWAGADATLRAQARHRHLPRDEIRRREAVLHAAKALAAEAAGNAASARRAALAALDLDPGLGAAAAIAARHLAADGKMKRAEEVLLTAWRKQPAPEITETWGGLRTGEGRNQRVDRFARLADANPTHIESRLLAAEIAIARHDWDGARSALGSTPEENPTARACAVMAAIEKVGNENEDRARSWLARALSAPRGARWTCGECRAELDGWQSVCPECHAFGSAVFRAPAAPPVRVRDAPLSAIPSAVEEAPALQKPGRSEPVAEIVRPDA